MADVFKINSGNAIYNSLGVVFLPNTGIRSFNAVGNINISGLENKYSGEFLPSTVASTAVDTTNTISLGVVAPTIPVTTGNNQAYYLVPPEVDSKVVNFVHAYVITTGTGNTTDIMLTRTRSGSTVNVLTSALKIDSGENGTDTSANPAVIDSSNATLNTYDVLSINITGQHTSPAKGLIITLSATA